MTLGDYITWGTALIGAFALLRLAYHRYLPTIQSALSWLYYAIDDYVVQYQTDREVDLTVKPPISAPMETETSAVPARPVAGKLDGTSTFHFQTPEMMNSYVETLLTERLAELVLAGKLEKSIAIKVGLRAPTGRAYQAAKEQLETAMQKQRYPALTASRTKATSAAK